MRALTGVLVILGATRVGASGVEGQYGASVDSILVMRAFATFSLTPYQPIALDTRYWTLTGKPGSNLAAESVRRIARLLDATPSQAENVLKCPPEIPVPSLHPRCKLQNFGALLALAAPIRVGDTLRLQITVVLDEAAKMGGDSEVHRLLLWVLPGENGWRVARQEIVYSRPRQVLRRG